jgi:hypothetical protein
VNSVLVSNRGIGHSRDDRSRSLLSVASGNALYICHPDRSAKGMCSFKKPYGAEWRDPERVSSTMLRQGVLPKLPIVARGRGENVPACTMSALLLNRLTCRRKAKATGMVSGKNSLTQHGQGRFIGISPLRARVFLMGQTASSRSGRDDRRRFPMIDGTLRRSFCSAMKDVA